MKDKTRVDLGMHVEVELLERSGAGERMAFDIVPDQEADFAHGLLGASTPLAKALIGNKADSVVPYAVDELVAVRILSLSPSVAQIEDAAARRKEAVKKAIRDAERTNAIVFASSFSGKWGDYDPDGMIEDEDEGG